MDDETTVPSSTKDNPFISGTSRNPKIQDLANARRLRRSSDKNMKGQSSHAFSSLQSSISTGHKTQTHRPGEGVHELVKYMSTVPSYLQHLEKSDTSQTKALNMGVIDWGYLQKWQYRHGAVENHENVDSSGRCAPASSEIYGSSSVCVKKTSSAPRHLHEPHRGERQAQVGHKKSSRPFSSFLNMDSTFHSVGQPGTSGSNSESNTEIRNGQHEVRTGNSNCSDYGGRCDSQELGSFRSASSILDIEEALHASETKMSTSELPDAADLKKTACGGSSSTVHTTPENVRRNGQSIDGTQTVEDLRNWSDRFSFESAGSDNPSAVLNCEDFSGLFMSEDPYLTTQYSDVPHSCPFPLGCSDSGLLQGPGPGEWNCISNPLTLPNLESSKLSSADGNNGPDCSKNGKSVVDELSVKLPVRCAGSISADGGLNDVPEVMVPEVMVPICRKTLPADCCTVTIGRHRPNDAASTTSKATSSASSKFRKRPLRKMLDVLLKSRSSNQKCHGTATASPVNSWRRLSFAGKAVPQEDAQVSRSLDVPDIHASVGTCVGGRKSMTSSAWVSSPLGAVPQDQKHGTSKKRQQALMRLSWKDQLPVFTFSMDDSDVLVAYRSKATLLNKHNSNCCYSIYSISKAKKKHGGGWMIQGSRQKEFVSRAVAKIVYSSHPRHGTDEKYSSAMETQFVLVGSQLRPTTLSKLHFAQENELAAFVIRLPEFTRNDSAPGLQKASDPVDYGINTTSTTDESSHDLLAQTDVEARVNIGSCNTIAILPSEVHGSSDAGGPSPLIERWKSGGLCDCGGWDVGCSLTILSGDLHECKSKEDQPPAFITNGRVQTELFVQGRSREDMPVFCLAELDQGLYEVEFEPFIATLQAFSLCVGIVHCQRTECPPPVVPNFLRQVDAGNSHNRNVRRGHVEAPASYVLNRPPLSPVGRA